MRDEDLEQFAVAEARPDASRALKDLVGTDDYTELSFRGGHIGIYVSSRAREVPATVHDWLAERAR